MALQQLQGAPVSVRRRESEWPPVGPMARPEMNRRGPGISPVSTAVLMPQSAPPVSRTVVKPRSIMPRISSADLAVSRVSGTCSRLRMFTSVRKTWTWQSIRPGIRVRLPQSTTWALADLMGLAETSRIVSPSTRTSWPPRASSQRGSSRLKFLNKICDIDRPLLRGGNPTPAAALTLQLRHHAPGSRLRYNGFGQEHAGGNAVGADGPARDRARRAVL